MNFTEHKKTIGAFVVILILGGLFIYEKKEERGDDDIKNIDLNSTEIKEGAYRGNGYTIEVIKDETVVPKIPSDLLNPTRRISFSPDLSLEVQKILSDKIIAVINNLEKDKNSFADWIALGNNLKIASDYDGARRAWEYAAALYPKDYIAPSNLGDLYHYYLKNFPLAEKSLLKAVENNPKFVEGYKNLYDLYTLSYTEKKNLALPALERGLKENPRDANLINWINVAKTE